MKIIRVYKKGSMKKELIIAILLGIAGLLFLGFVLTNVPGKKPTTNQQTQVSMPTLAQSQTQTFTNADVAAHASSNDCYMIVENNVYNLTSYLSEHPSDITMYCGKDATVAFTTKNGKGPHSAKDEEKLNTMLVGKVTQ